MASNFNKGANAEQQKRDDFSINSTEGIRYYMKKNKADSLYHTQKFQLD